MATITPFVKRMRTQGGTIYTFTSALEDIGLNINERNNIVKMSHYALLDIPSIDAPPTADASTVNRFNVFAIPGAFKSWLDSGSIKDGRVIVAESFQNYALNLETFLLSSTDYNPALSTTVSERVLWKWLKETGAIRWAPEDTSAGVYWREEQDSDVSVGYNSVVKAIGTISAGSVRTDTFGTYNETYVLVPTSFGQTPVWFKQVEDDNYYHGMTISTGLTNILGRNPYTKPHPDGLDIKAYYDLMDSSTAVNSYNMFYSDDNSEPSNAGWWWTYQGLNNSSDENKYYIDDDDYLTSEVYNLFLKYDDGGTAIKFKRSNVECMSVEFDINKLRTILEDESLSYDDLAIEYAEDDSYEFNAILLYYSVMNKSLDKVLATNLLGILFLDTASGNTSSYGPGGMEITIPSITKLQSGATGFGTSYSIKLNIKSDYMLDDTKAIVTDTTSAVNIEDFSTLFDNLGKSLSILNQHTGTINFIAEQYIDLSSQQSNIVNEINDIQNQVNAISRNIEGTTDTIAMFSDGDDPLIESSIYMKHGKIGIFNNNPTWPVQIDASLKTKDIFIENAIRDTSGNILIGYGSPLQIGSSDNNRPIVFYSGSGGPFMTVQDGSLFFNRNVIFDASIQNASGNPITSPDVNLAYVDGSLAQYIKEASLGSEFTWAMGKLHVDVSVVAGGVTQAYVDGSLDFRDTSIAGIYTALEDYATIVAVNASLGTYTTLTQFNASLGTYATVAAVNASIGEALTNMYLPEPSTGLSSPDSDGIYVKLTAGATIASRRLVYIGATGRALVADADSSSQMPAVAINHTNGSYTSGNTYNFLINGVYRHTTENFVIGKQVYTGLDGYLTTTRPTAAVDCVQVMGIAISNDAMIFNPSPDFIVLK